MEKVKIFTKNTPKETCELDELIKYGRMLHSEAIFLGISKFFSLFRHDIEKTGQLEEKQGNLKYSH